MDGAFGYNLPLGIGNVLGREYIGKLAQRFTNQTGDVQDMVLEVGHDTTIDMILTALGIAK